MANHHELEKLFQPRSTRWRPSAGWILAVALPTTGLLLFVQWTIRALKVEPDNWPIAVVGVLLMLAAMVGVALTLVLLALAWLRR